MSDSAPKLDLLKIAGLRKKKDARDKYATFNRRMMAATIDSFIVMILVAPPVDFIFNHVYGRVIPLDMLALSQHMAAQPRNAFLIFMQALYRSRWISNFMLQMGVLAGINGLCWHFWSATPGKILLRIKIADAVSELPITDRQIALRLLGYILSTIGLCIGFFWIGIDKKRQGWHDKLANTVVIAMPRQTTPAPATADPSGFPAPSATE